MFTLRIENTVSDFDEWKRLFDSDPLDRRESNVRSYRVMRTLDDPKHVMVDLDFETRAAAEQMHTALQGLWQGRAAVVIRDPHAQLVEIVDAAVV